MIPTCASTSIPIIEHNVEIQVQPNGVYLPMFGVATTVVVVASQAMISTNFS